MEEVYRQIIVRLLRKKFHYLSHDVEFRIDYSPLNKLNDLLDSIFNIKDETEVLEILS